MTGDPMASPQPRPYVSIAADRESGVTTPSAYLAESLARIDDLDPTLGAFVVVNREEALQAADESTSRWRAGRPISPVDGMPVAVKDVIDTIDMPTGQGSPLWSGTLSHRDAAAVKALRDAGAVIVGKTTTTEFAATHAFHATRNPHDPGRTPGGSSSGSAAAVAAGMVPAALATQVIGSILRPASFCGVVGLKPSHGAINRGGSHDHLSQSCQGAIGATLVDAWAVLRAIADRAGGDPGHVGLLGDVDFSRPVRPQRIAVLETGGWSEASEGARSAFAVLLSWLEDERIELGGRRDDPRIEEVERAVAEALPQSLGIGAWESRWPLNTYADLDSTRLSPDSLRRLAQAESMTQADYGDLLARRHASRTIFAAAAREYDCFVTLGACGAAPLGFASTGNPGMNVAASYLGCPAVTLPLLQDDGLPLGLQLLGRPAADAALVAGAAWMEAAAPGRRS